MSLIPSCFPCFMRMPGGGVSFQGVGTTEGDAPTSQTLNVTEFSSAGILSFYLVLFLFLFFSYGSS